jgi:RimJ/RimL family protein N-acetyltransferase
VSRGHLPRPAQPLTDGVVTLRAWREADIPSVVRICQDPEIARFTRVPSPYTEEHAIGFLERHEEEELGFAIVEADDEDTVLGAIGMRDDGEGRGEFGYWVAAEARGRGVAARALRLLVEWGFGEVGLDRLQVFTHVDNPGSQRTAERAGFRREGVLREYMLIKGQRHDAVIYGLTAQDVASAP